MRLARWVHRVRLVKPVQPDHRARKARRDLRATLAQRVRPDRWARRGRPVRPGHRVRKDQRDPPAQMAMLWHVSVSSR